MIVATNGYFEKSNVKNIEYIIFRAVITWSVVVLQKKTENLEQTVTRINAGCKTLKNTKIIIRNLALSYLSCFLYEAENFSPRPRVKIVIKCTMCHN